MNALDPADPLRCGVCLDPLGPAAVETGCGHAFCAPCLARLVRTADASGCAPRCAACRAVVAVVVPSYALRAAVARFSSPRLPPAPAQDDYDADRWLRARFAPAADEDGRGGRPRARSLADGGDGEAAEFARWMGHLAVQAALAAAALLVLVAATGAAAASAALAVLAAHAGARACVARGGGGWAMLLASAKHVALAAVFLGPPVLLLPHGPAPILVSMLAFRAFQLAATRGRGVISMGAHGP